MAIDLFDGDDSSTAAGDGAGITINQDYARRLEHNKRREALQRLQDLKNRGLAGDSDEDSDDSSDDEEDDPHLSSKPNANDLKFLETLIRVKRKDPAIFDKDTKIYSSDDEDDVEKERTFVAEGSEFAEKSKKVKKEGSEFGEKSKKVEKEGVELGEKSKKKKKEKALYLKDVNARNLIEEGREFDDEVRKFDRKVYNREQSEGIKAFLEAEREAFAEDDDEDILREKERFGGDEEEDPIAEKFKQNLSEYFGEEDEMDESDKFLKDYIEKRMWVDTVKDKKISLEEIIDVSEEEDELDKQDKYEASYNFRHEEGQVDRVLGHSRVVEGSIRKKSNSRKTQRESKKARMAQAELERKEELKHLKNLKKKEIQEKLDKIRAIAGIGDKEAVLLDASDLEDEFDPEEHNRKMNEMFGDDYYEGADADPEFGSDDDDLEKPDFDKEDELLGLPKDWETGESSEGFEAARLRYLKQKQVEDPEQEGKAEKKQEVSPEEELDRNKVLEEYYKLDYEDTIGDLKTRFKYKPVQAKKFGLQTWEILAADDKNLNHYVSLKKLAPYVEKEWKVTHHQKKKKDTILQIEEPDQKKKKVKKHKFKEGTSSMDTRGEKPASQIERKVTHHQNLEKDTILQIEEPDQKKKVKKHKFKEGPSSMDTPEEKPTSQIEEANGEGDDTQEEKPASQIGEANGEADDTSRKSKRKRRHAELKLSQVRLEAYGIIPSKKHHKKN